MSQPPLFNGLRAFLEGRKLSTGEIDLAVQCAVRDVLDEQPAAASAPTTAAGAVGATKAQLESIVDRYARERLSDG